MLEDRDAIPDRCPCCASYGTTHLFQRRLDVSGERVELFICRSCTAITNRTNLIKEQENSGEALQIQISSADEFYSQKIDDLRLHQNEENITALNELLGGILGGRTVVDLGAGEGYLAAAATSLYETAWAVDVNIGLLSTTVPQFGLGKKLKIGGALDDVPGEIDAVFMWHRLEHIPDAHGIGCAVAGRIKEGGLFIWQVPAYRDPYVVMSHYTFFNDYAARMFTKSIGLEVVKIFHDEALQFLTVVSMKSGISTDQVAIPMTTQAKKSFWGRLRV